MGRWGDGEMGCGKCGKFGKFGGRGKLDEQLAPQDGATFLLPTPSSEAPCSLFPVPYSLFPKSRARGKRQELIKYSAASLLPIPCSLFPIPCSEAPRLPAP
ncbi:MAG: hypothetical protein F6J90_13240 [Moorea sp. SIOASIH]|uniref:hypothetical protein n=1 Tax=Moorena sp. SIOASIH TaxID=2607817 RepID=UPI0013BCC11B|nr:hypothetical protein [Moorena sp. SIOASIH]NEO37231.1 hypothetical protein [Moorena sp. SIOASIH]